MKLSVRAPVLAFLQRLQRAYAQVIRQGTPRVPHEENHGPPGGSFARDVLRHDLVTPGRTGGTFTPSRLGAAFRLWWNGSSHQRARGRDLPLDEEALARAVVDDLVRQIEAQDRRSP